MYNGVHPHKTSVRVNIEQRPPPLKPERSKTSIGRSTMAILP
jgi:hypothetical protein